MTRASTVVALCVVAMVGVYGCAKRSNPSAAQVERIKNLEARCAKLEEDYRTAAMSRDRMRRQVSMLEEERSRLQEGLQAEKTHVAEVSKQLSQEKEQHTLTRKQAKAEMEALAAQEAQTKAELHLVIAQAEQANRNLQKQLAQADEELKGLRRTLEEDVELKNNLQQQLAQEQAAKTEAEAQHVRMLQKLEAIVACEKKEKQCLKQQLVKAQEDSRAKLTKLETRERKIIAELEDRSNEMGILRQRCTMLKKGLRDLLTQDEVMATGTESLPTMALVVE